MGLRDRRRELNDVKRPDRHPRPLHNSPDKIHQQGDTNVLGLA